MSPPGPRSLALKYRPQNFDQVVGQEITVRILQNALKDQKIHHAFLFSGPRGTGKTTLARILAKAVNCEHGPTPTPCGQCLSCQEITEGKSLSVLEIDGASNTSVDDVRQLRENVRYLPAGGHYKVYIIDEVHMLSNAAFNALLKTLEEPPPHVLFVFATTEPQKVPTTVISRVLRFDLRPFPVSTIVGQLKKIAAQERIEAEETALFEIAREATGSLRDAIGLLDQLIDLSGNKIGSDTVESVLGVSPHRFVRDLAAAILEQQPDLALGITEKASREGLDPKRLATHLLEYLRHLLVASAAGGDPALFDLPQDQLAEIVHLSKKVSQDALDWLFQILEKGLADLARSPNARILLDVLAIRLCRSSSLQPLEEILKKLEETAAGFPTPIPTREKKEPLSLFDGATQKMPSWPDFLGRLRSTKPQIASLVAEGHLKAMTDDALVLAFPPGSLHREMLEDPERLGHLQDAVHNFFGRTLSVRLEAHDAPPSPKTEPGGVLEAALDIFQPRATKTVPPEFR